MISLVKHGWKKLRFLKRFLGLQVFRFLYEDRTRKYDPIAHEKHPIHGIRRILRLKDKSPVSEGEHRVKNEDEINDADKSQLKF